ncbi:MULTISPECIES: nucleotidyltransferase family protein [unclassified Pseudodesulfovibrio]|uniref:nucleotidyltransferase family protein n=1 Tax=unclassified Pseudodesulfovibrio TaxID=2661612 RepID=UPI000FEBED9B|nr:MULTISPECIES: nucleotidyltransferase family protein [unclassified Pseudodesulfovibrio]MCJ2164729.1 nucleotidyltransferase family protein [Pseudodesulfovibrio sp. S3-i]RWU04082.1 nucleotidyltransferase family protein [Pseudodesulfovibrio sp. S3]
MYHHSANVSGIILAAGKAARMGRDKLSLPFRGLPLLQHVVNAARNSALQDVTVVLPKGAELRRTVDLSGCNVVTSVHRDMGQAESLKTGLRSVMDHADGCMALLGDQPLITASAIDMLIGAFAQQPECWVAPVQEGMRGNPITIPSSWFPKVFELEGDTGARPLFGSPGLALRLVRIHEVGPFIDVDTEQQYQRLLANYDANTA